MAGDDEEYPIGFRFKPREEELVEYYLMPRLTRQPTVPNQFITECDVYSCHPDILTAQHQGVDEEEWYFLSPRARMYGNGVRPKRKTEDGRGRWKASTAAKEVEQKVVCNGITFWRSVLNYFEGVPKRETRTKWIMLELKVPSFEIKIDKSGQNKKLDNFVVCKIYVSPQSKNKGDADGEEGTSSASACEGCDAGEEACPSSPTQHGLSEKQAGKRPMLDKGRPGPGSLAIAPAQAIWPNTTSNASSSSQAPPMEQRQAGTFHGQGGLVQQPTHQTPAVPYQKPPFTDARDQQPFGRTTATTTPPPAVVNLGFPGNPPRRIPGWAFRPHVSLQCYYDHPNNRGVKPPAGNASSSQPQPQQLASSFLPPPQPLFNADATRRGAAASAAAAAPGGTPYGSYPYQSSPLLTLEQAAGHYGAGAANGTNGAARWFDVNDEQYFVDLATTTSNPSLTGGAPTQTAPAPARLVELESQAAAAPGAAKVETETEEMPGPVFSKKDAV